MILNSIKSATAENHKSLESSILMLPVSENSLTKDNYINILKTFYGYFSPLENLLAKKSDLLKHLPDFNERRKSELILKDLKFFGQADHAIEICQDIPEVNNLSQAFGCLYVMEGSTLGGQFISRSAGKQLSLENEDGILFFSGYKMETGKKWKAFQEALVAYCEKSDDEEVIIESANDTFNKLSKWFNKTEKQGII